MRRWIHIIAAACVLGLAAPAAGEPGRAPELPSLDIKIGHSRVVRLKQTVKRVSVGKPEIADVLVINTHQVYVNAKGVGSTNITVWGKEDRLVGIFEVRAYRDLSLLKKRLHEVLPGEPIEVRELQGAVVLSGRVSSTEAKSQAELLAKAMAPRDDLAKQIHKQQQLDRWVVNVLEVGAVKQVSLKVRFAEVRRDALKSLKINLGFRDLAGSFFNTFLGGLTFPLPPTNNQDPWSSNYNNQLTPWSDRPFDVGHSSKTNIAGGLVWDNTNRLMTYIEALKDNGLARVLAEPNLVAASGGEAEFLAGGEFPIPVPQKDNITIYFKKFGVRLKFKPEVLSGGRIRMEVEPEVSDLDWSAAVQIASYAVPGLTTRKAKTQLELADGQVFGMAGMFRDDLAQTVSKVPWLGDIPILGALFRSTEFQNNKTELVILVTPHIVKPGEGAPTRVPGEQLNIPSEFDLLMGEMVTEKTEPAGAKGQGGVPVSPRELEGRFGHELPY
jgi:pilus assembly protein CpaC